MTSVPNDAAPVSPWLSVWLRPRETIGRIIATNPRRHALLIYALSYVSILLLNLIGEKIALNQLDWRIVAAAVMASAILCVVSFYGTAFFLRWSGKIMGGRASQAAMRAVLAWGTTPYLVALALYIIVLISWQLTGNVGALKSSAAILALQMVMLPIVLWSLVVTMLMLARAQGFGFWRTTANAALGWIIISALIALVIRTFLFQPFNIPSGSQMPTLLVGDYLFVSKYTYGYSRYSFPFSPPPFTGRILASEPQRGDLAVFRLPRDDSIDYIMRIVGLPGDRIQMRKGLLHINGAPVKRDRIQDFRDEENGRVRSVKRWRETLPNGVSYETLDLIDNSFLDNTPEYRVPAGQYFMMGDNRDNSNDSRVPAERQGVGYVPLENIVGRAAVLFFSIDRGTNTPRIRSERIGMVVR